MNTRQRKSDFTFEGYNDQPKPCQEQTVKGRQCSGTVRPTWNANMGQCDRCQARVAWTALRYIEAASSPRARGSRR